MKKYVIFFVALLVWGNLSLLAQMDHVWEAKAGSRIFWNKFAPNGSIICGTEDHNTVAFSAETGQVIWKKSFNYGSFDILPNTPFIYYHSDENGLLVIDPENGKELCNSQVMGMKDLVSFYPVRAGNNLLVYTQMDDQEQFWLVSLSTGKLLWKQDLALDKDTKIAGGFISIEEDPEAKGLMCDPVGDGKGGVFVAVHDRLIHMDKDGKIGWNIEYPSMFGNQDGFFKAATVKFSKMFPDKTGDNLYVFSGGYMSSFKATDGTLSWDEPVKVTGPVENLIFDEKGMILIPASDGNATKKHKLNMVDYETGKTFWGEKGIEFKGGYIQSRYCQKGIAFITKSYMAETFFINFIDPNTGVLEIEKSLKIFPGPYEFEEVNGGLLISSRFGANIYNYTTKELTINKELKTGGTDYLIKADAGKKVYFFTSAKTTIYEFNKETLEAKEFNLEKIKIKGGDEVEGLTVYEDGLVLNSAQNLIKFNWDGSTAYEKFYQAPGQGWMNVTGNVLGATFKVLGGLATVAASYATVAAVEDMDQQTRAGMDVLDKTYEETYGVDADLMKYRQDVSDYKQGMDEAKQELNQDMQEMAQMGVLSMGAISDNINAIAKRFKHSKATKNYVLLMTNDKERGGTGLAVVSKIDGEIKGFIPMKFSKENPCYTVDPFTNTLFWMPSLDNGKNNFGRYNDIQGLMDSGTIYTYDLNKL